MDDLLQLVKDKLKITWEDENTDREYSQCLCYMMKADGDKNFLVFEDPFVTGKIMTSGCENLCKVILYEFKICNGR